MPFLEKLSLRHRKSKKSLALSSSDSSSDDEYDLNNFNPFDQFDMGITSDGKPTTHFSSQSAYTVVDSPLTTMEEFLNNYKEQQGAKRPTAQRTSTLADIPESFPPNTIVSTPRKRQGPVRGATDPETFRRQNMSAEATTPSFERVSGYKFEVSSHESTPKIATSEIPRVTTQPVIPPFQRVAGWKFVHEEPSGSKDSGVDIEYKLYSDETTKGKAAIGPILRASQKMFGRDERNEREKIIEKTKLEPESEESRLYRERNLDAKQEEFFSALSRANGKQEEAKEDDDSIIEHGRREDRWKTCQVSLKPQATSKSSTRKSEKKENKFQSPLGEYDEDQKDDDSIIERRRKQNRNQKECQLLPKHDTASNSSMFKAIEEAETEKRKEIIDNHLDKIIDEAKNKPEYSHIRAQKAVKVVKNELEKVVSRVGNIETAEEKGVVKRKLGERLLKFRNRVMGRTKVALD